MKQSRLKDFSKKVTILTKIKSQYLKGGDGDVIINSDSNILTGDVGAL